MRVAAGRKGITQPALTKSLKMLENEVESDLFKRTAKGLEPTETGDALYRYARAIDQESRFASLDIQRSTIETRGLLRLGVGPALAISNLSPVLASFYQTFPKVEVDAVVDITTQLLGRVISGDLDVMVTARPEQEIPEHFSSVRLFDHRMVAICREGHPLRRLQSVSIEQLCRYPRIGFLEDHDFGVHARKTYGTHAAMFTAMRTNDMSLTFDVLAATDHFTIVNEMVLPRAQRRGIFQLPLDDPLWVIHIELICKLAFIDSRPIRTLLDAWAKVDVAHASGLGDGGRHASKA